MYINGKFYSYNPNKTAAEYNRIYKKNISPKAVNSNVKRFIDKGWCTINKQGHLAFSNQSDIVESYNLSNLGSMELNFDLKKDIKYNTVRLKIYKEIFDRKISQQHLLLETKSEATKKSVRQKGLRIFDDELLEKTMDSTDKVVNISYAGLSKVFNTSQSGAYYIMKEILSNSSLNKINRNVKVISGNMAGRLNGIGLKGHFYNGNEFTFVTYPNQYTYAK